MVYESSPSPSARDLKHIWHPCSQMKDYEKFPPIEIKSASGCILYAANGDKIIDAISSWWCKSLGHKHPRIIKAVKAQLNDYEHIIGANTCQKPLIELSEKLCKLTPYLQKVFYTGDGSCAVEVAMKMALHAHKIQGDMKRTRFASLTNGYHGETALTLSISDLGIYKDPYEPILIDYPRITPPYVNSPDDPLWHNAEKAFNTNKTIIDKYSSNLAAIIVEPIVQGAGGMRFYSPDFLRRLAKYSRENNIYLIADEIMTGVGRTGSWLASEHANIEPDFVCLSKGLTSGFGSFSAVLTRNDIYNLFYDDYENQKSFLHSQTYSGNVLCATAALATLNTIEDENILEHLPNISRNLKEGMDWVASQVGDIENTRCIGGIVACELQSQENRLGFEVFKKGLGLGAFLRPLGNTLYWSPPLNITEVEIEQLAEITAEAIKQARDSLNRQN